MKISEDQFTITIYTYSLINKVVRELNLNQQQEQAITDIAINSINSLLKKNLFDHGNN